MVALRRELRSFAELFALCGFAVVQPALDLFGRNPQQFVFRGADGQDVVAFGLVVVLVPPLALWAIEAGVGIFAAELRRRLHSVLLAVLVAAMVVQAARPLLNGTLLMVLAATLGAAGALLHRRYAAVRLWVAFAAAAPVAFFALFVLASPTARLLGDEPVLALQQGVGSPAPVVLVVFDELPLTSIVDSEGRVDSDLFPNLADLAADSHWFRNATTLTTHTWHAVPGIVTGRVPQDGLAPFARDHPDNLFTLLGGFDLNVTESYTRLCPTNLCEVGPSAYGGRHELINDVVEVMRARLSWSGPQGDPAAGLVEPTAESAPGAEGPDDDLAIWGSISVPSSVRFESFLGGITDDRAALHYLHVLLPHQPFRHLPSGRTYEDPAATLGRTSRGAETGRERSEDWVDDPVPPALGRQRHLLQLAYTDSLVGRLLDTLREKNIYDEALVIVTADHGIGFRPGGPVRHFEDEVVDDGAAPELMWVPLFVKLPGQTEGATTDANALLIDVLPTVADVLDIDLPWQPDGRSLFGPERTEPSKPFVHFSVAGDGLHHAGEELVDGPAGLQEVFDLGVDRFLPAVGAPDRFWRRGPSPDLLGTTADPRTQVDAHGFDATPEVDAAGGSVPALVVASVAAGAGDELAVAVNGTIGATTEAFDDSGTIRVAAVVDDRLFVDGTNEITIHRLP